MAFVLNNITLLSVQYVPPVLNVPQWWGYNAGADTIAEVSAAGYFNVDPSVLLTNSQFRIGDMIYCVCSDGNTTRHIATLPPNVTTI